MEATSKNIKPVFKADELLSSFLKGEFQEQGEDVCPDCETPLRIEVERREGGYSEEVAYCEGCGNIGIGK